jgi:hypothetical protein
MKILGLKRRHSLQERVETVKLGLEGNFWLICKGLILYIIVCTIIVVAIKSEFIIRQPEPAGRYRCLQSLIDKSGLVFHIR